MMCYRDMTFCPFHEDCKAGTTCFRSLTKEVEQGAERWFGPDAPISVFTGKPKCFDQKDTEK